MSILSQAGGGNVSTTTYQTAELANKIELAKLNKMRMAIENYIDTGIQKTILDSAEQIRSDLEKEAPFDTVPYDTYHMNEHMVRTEFSGSIGGKANKGQQVDSEAAYSGHLEYGTAYHGVQHIFFRPVDERNKKAYKQEVILRMKKIFTK